jgi:hypothetical protein
MTSAHADSDEISAFLDEPGAPGMQSRVYLRFAPNQYVKTVERAMFYVYHFRTIPMPVFQLGNVDTKPVEIRGLGLHDLTFGCSPLSGNADDDLAAILDWFEKSNVAVAVMPRVVTDWYPAQFSGSPFWKGLGVDSGWIPIVNDVCRQVQAALTANELEGFHWLQIKQENGGLTMFWGPAYRAVLDSEGPHHNMDFESKTVIRWRFDESVRDFTPATRKRVQAIIADAQTRAAQTCEHCSGAGMLQRASLTVLCEVCCKRWEQLMHEEDALQTVQAQFPSP